VVGGDKAFYTTGRMTGEIVRKSALIGVPIIVSRNGASSLGCDLAKQLGMALFGRAVKRRFLCYVGAERFDPQL
jgi:FdhD protein